MMFKIMLSAFLLFTSSIVFAQSSVQKTNILNEQSVVRGEDGMVYPYKVWKKLMATGQYAVRDRKTKTDAGQPEYVIVKLDEQQKAIDFEEMPKPLQSDAFQIDQLFNGNKLTDINGKKFDLKNLDGKTLVLNFWFTNGKLSTTLIPAFNDIYETYKDNNNAILLAICNDDKYQIKDFLTNTPFQFNIVADGRSLAEKYGVKSYPTTIVVDKNNQIKFSSVGTSASMLYWIKKAVDTSLGIN